MYTTLYPRVPRDFTSFTNVLHCLQSLAFRLQSSSSSIYPSYSILFNTISESLPLGHPLSNKVFWSPIIWNFYYYWNMYSPCLIRLVHFNRYDLHSSIYLKTLKCQNFFVRKYIFKVWFYAVHLSWRFLYIYYEMQFFFSKLTFWHLLSPC